MTDEASAPVSIRVLSSLLRAFFRFLLSLRYRVTIDGADKAFASRRPGVGTLVLPNHPAYVDPGLLMIHLGRWTELRPVVFTDTVQNKVLRPLMILIRAVEIPNLAKPSRQAREEARGAIDAIVEGLRRGETILLYPSGRLQRKGVESIGAASATAEILARVPEANVVLVRTQGIWGSMFSFAPTTRLPHLDQCMLRGIWILLGNLLFFTPRRDVRIRVEWVDRALLPPPEDRRQLNIHLEEWYNRGNDPAPKFVPYHFFLGPRTFDFPDPEAAGKEGLDRVSDAVKGEVVAILEARLKRTFSEVERQPDASLEALGLDSLDRMEVVLELEERFGFQSQEEVATLGDLFLVASGLAEGTTAPGPKIPADWEAESEPMAPLVVLDETLVRAFARRALASPRWYAAADDLAGAVTYERLLVGARLMAKRFAKLEAPAVGVMLPATVAADTVFFALHIAGKLPVMMNWTTGPANLAHGARVAGLREVVTSRKFVDRLGIDIEGVRFLFLEDLRKEIGKIEALGMLLDTRMRGKAFLEGLPGDSPGDPAVVLFTSGSEKAPKAVPLTHANLIANVREGGKALGLRRGDLMLGFLPAFHSFGLTGNILGSLLTGMRLLHHPDPTQAGAIVRKIRDWRPTVVLTTPTFLGHIVRRAKPGDLDSLRIIVTGAEACPEWVRQSSARLAQKAVILEGYGITECSPVVSANRPGQARDNTLGRPLDGVHVRVVGVDGESITPVPPGETGMLLVHGPSVFPGYLGDAPSPFREMEGKRWYVTGDLVAVDADGFIHFRGRLKRFLKAGGEMISLPAMEAPLAERWPANDEGPRVAVEGIEREGGGRFIVLFTTETIDLREANQILGEAGLRGVMRFDDVRKVAAIPLLGTGKTDYKALRAELTEAGKAVLPTAASASIPAAAGLPVIS
jgi:long-chain-fatty-acid--[acyl-carrier-protein] ligase